MRTLFVALCCTVLGCGSDAVGPDTNLHGRWTLATANGAALPNQVAHSGSITFLDGNAYEAITCYATSPPPCDGGRIEQGTFVLSGNSVTLTDGAYVRSLVRSGNRLTQTGGGDTGSVVLVYVK